MVFLKASSVLAVTAASCTLSPPHHLPVAKGHIEHRRAVPVFAQTCHVSMLNPSLLQFLAECTRGGNEIIQQALFLSTS